MATPLRNGNGKLIGVAAFQIPFEPINNIMKKRNKMDETEEVYLVGQDHLMRSDSYIDPVNHGAKVSFKNKLDGSINTESVRSALAGKSVSDIILAYQNKNVLSVGYTS